MNANYANKPLQWPITAKSNIPKELQVKKIRKKVLLKFR